VVLSSNILEALSNGFGMLSKRPIPSGCSRNDILLQLDLPIGRPFFLQRGKALLQASVWHMLKLRKKILRGELISVYNTRLLGGEKSVSRLNVENLIKLLFIRWNLSLLSGLRAQGSGLRKALMSWWADEYCDETSTGGAVRADELMMIWRWDDAIYDAEMPQRIPVPSTLDWLDLRVSNRYTDEPIEAMYPSSIVQIASSHPCRYLRGVPALLNNPGGMISIIKLFVVFFAISFSQCAAAQTKSVSDMSVNEFGRYAWNDSR